MADDADHSVLREQRILEMQLNARREEGPKATGYCLNPRCGDRLSPGLRWCDATCRDTYERIRGTK